MVKSLFNFIAPFTCVLTLFPVSSIDNVLHTSNRQLINISSIIADTDMGEQSVVPSDQLILTFIYNQAQPIGYGDLINDLGINRDSNTQATVSVINDYSVYTGSIEITWVLTNKINLSTIFTTNLTNTYREDDLLAMNGNEINPYFKQIVTETYAPRDDIRWNQLNLQNVDFTSATAKQAGAGTITITPKPYSDVYTGVGNITFPETFTTLNIVNFPVARTTQSFTAPQDGNYILEAWGSKSGGISQSGSEGTRGRGAYTSGEIYLQQNETIYVYVGNFDNSTSSRPFNGGGAKLWTKENANNSGGGGTDFRLKANDDINYPDGWSDPLSLNSRIMVAGGGGGRGAAGGGNWDGAAGGINGFPLLNTVGNTQTCGGTQISGGLGQKASGSFGKGPDTSGNFCGGGGGGYYGGGLAYQENDGGVRSGGGSSFISGYDGCIAIANPMTDESDPRTPKTTGDVSVLNYDNQDWRFYSILMINGKSTMYKQDGKSSIGNDTTGYARISYITH